MRGRLVELERRLGVELYRKQRGPRQATPLTPAGSRLLPRAIAFLQQARELSSRAPDAHECVRVAASQYLTMYLLIDAVRRFHTAYPHIQVVLSTLSEQHVETALRHDPELAFGVVAPYETVSEFDFVHLFSLTWSFLAPPNHPLLRKQRLSLADLAELPLIVFERGSSGRQHVMEAFRAARLTPRLELETTTTEIIVRMVEARLGVSIVPLLPGGAVTRGRRVRHRELGTMIRPIESGILTRRGEQLSPACQQFVEFVRSQTPAVGKQRTHDEKADRRSRRASLCAGHQLLGRMPFAAVAHHAVIQRIALDRFAAGLDDQPADVFDR